MAQDKKIITLTDKEVDLSDYAMDDVCEITIKGKIIGINREPRYGTMPLAPGEKEKKPKKWIEYSIEVLAANEEDVKDDKNKEAPAWYDELTDSAKKGKEKDE